MASPRWLTVWILAVLCLPIAAGAQVIERISVSSAGVGGSGDSQLSCREAPITSNGRYVVFESDAPDLVPDDFNGVTDVFLRDRVLGTTTRLSVDTDGNDADGASIRPCITPDGHFVVFDSEATDLVPGDGNGEADVFLRDLTSGTTSRISLDRFGGEANGGSRIPSISDDGRFVAFVSNATDLIEGDGNGVADIFLRDRVLQLNERVSVDQSGGDPDANSWTPSMSSDGRYVAFHSVASNLVPGDGGVVDVFVRDRLLGSTVRATVSHLGSDPDGNSYGASISADGRHVSFWSRATNLIPDDTNGFEDTYVRDLDLATTERVSLRSDGSQIPDLPSWTPSMSGDGRYVSFFADSDQLVPGDGNGFSDVFGLDRAADDLQLLTVNAAGQQTDDFNHNPKTTPDGRLLLFQSTATNLVADDTNNAIDIFLAYGPAILFGDGFEIGTTAGWQDVGP